MSYRIEITGATITELSGKVLALAAQLQGNVAAETAPLRGHTAAEAEAEKPKTNRKAKTEPADTKPEPEAVKADDPAPTAEPETKAVDFDKDIVPKVLKLVEVKGREGIEAVLSQFGATKASQVAAEQHGELLAALEDALAATE